MKKSVRNMEVCPNPYYYRIIMASLYELGSGKKTAGVVVYILTLMCFIQETFHLFQLGNINNKELMLCFSFRIKTTQTWEYYYDL